MGEQTAISWTDHTFNPWWGCWKIAPECANCYADATAARYAPGHWGRAEPRRYFEPEHWKDLAKWNRKAERDGVRRRVFVGSMCDWAERHPVREVADRQFADLRRTWAAVRECASLDFLFLTKRPEDAAVRLPWTIPHLFGFGDGASAYEPWPNVWVGVSAGHRDSLDKVATLRRIPATVRFVSCEPLLTEITADEWDTALGGGAIHWLIVGNESGHKRRPAETEWVRTARDAAVRNGVAFHFKQWVEPNGRKVHLPILDGKQWAEFPAVRP